MSVGTVLRNLILYPGLVSCGFGLQLGYRRMHEWLVFRDTVLLMRGLAYIGVVCMTVPIIDLLRNLPAIAAADWHSWLFAAGVLLVSIAFIGLTIYEKHIRRKK